MTLRSYSKEDQLKRVKKKKAKKKRLISIPKLDKFTWQLVSIAYRLDDCDERGLVNCATCNKQMYYYGTKDCQMGHFVSRRKLSVKFNRYNQMSQCSYCNGPMGGGEQYKMGKAINKKYGEGTAERMQLESNKTVKFTRYDYKKVIYDCIKLIKENSRNKKLWDWKSSFNKWQTKVIEDVIDCNYNLDEELVLGNYRLP